MIKIHVDPESLNNMEPAIIIVDPDSKYTDQYTSVQLCCSKCNTRVGILDQQGDSAHLIIYNIDSLSNARLE
jgi:hypothetical protein